MTGAAAPPPSHMPGKATTISHRPSSPVCPTGTPTIPQSPPLVHFSSYTTTSSCTFLDTDMGIYKDRWRFSLIGFIAADTKAVEKQPLEEEPQGEPEFDPMSAEAAVAGEERADISDRKRAKLVTPSGPLGDHPPGSPSVVSKEDDTIAELPSRRQYLTRSKAAATSGRLGKALWKSRSSNSSSSAATLGNIASASSSSL
ncbi:hypothetical protein Peur_058623 [Populus x canadensis]